MSANRPAQTERERGSFFASAASRKLYRSAASKRFSMPSSPKQEDERSPSWTITKPLNVQSAAAFLLQHYEWKQLHCADLLDYLLRDLHATLPSAYHRIRNLFSSETEEETMGLLQEKLRQGDLEVAATLAKAVADVQLSMEYRAIALETLAAARSGAYFVLVARLISQCLDEGDEELKFAAIAACSELPPAARANVTPAILDLCHAEDAPESVRQAAAAYVQWDSTKEQNPQ